VIHEGFRGWNVRFYLVAIAQSPAGDPHLHVAYESILPYFPVLLEVYHGIQGLMFQAAATPEIHQETNEQDTIAQKS